MEFWLRLRRAVISVSSVAKKYESGFVFNYAATMKSKIMKKSQSVFVFNYNATKSVKKSTNYVKKLCVFGRYILGFYVIVGKNIRLSYNLRRDINKAKLVCAAQPAATSLVNCAAKQSQFVFAHKLRRERFY